MNQSLLPRPGFWALAAREKKARYSLTRELLRFLLVYLIASTIQGMLLAIPMTAWIFTAHGEELFAEGKSMGTITDQLFELMSNLPDWLVILSLFAALPVGIVPMFFCRKIERRSFASMGLGKDGAATEYLIGIAAGAVLFVGVALIGSAAGAFRFGAFSLNRADLPLLLAALVGCLVEGACFEIMLRGYLAPTMSVGRPVFVPLIMSTVPALLLASGDSGTLGTINILLLSLMLCLFTMRRGSIWGACGLHAAWLFTGNFVFGFSLSEKGPGPCLIPVEISSSLKKLLTGGSAGPEASICATIMLLAALGLVFALRSKDPAPPEAPTPASQGPDQNPL